MKFLKQGWFYQLADAVEQSAPEMVVGASRYCIQASWSGSPEPNQATAGLEGSLDGASWFQLATVTPNAPAAWVTGKPIAYLRVANYEMAGGTSPTVTVSVLAD
jgi:hypothetical protein